MFRKIDSILEKMSTAQFLEWCHTDRYGNVQDEVNKDDLRQVAINTSSIKVNLMVSGLL
jgi:hypothetical protein